jgi:ABC-2 type transport system ATP-binding protein
MAAQIQVEQLRKTFRVAEPTPGLRGAVLGLLRPRYREVHALDGVDFEIEKGELVAYIGPNGAGKSTTIKVMSGVLVPSSGHCRISGRVPWLDRVRHVARIGVVFGQRSQLFWDLPLLESFELLRAIYAVPRASFAERLEELNALLALEGLFKTPVRQLSLGQRMRAELAAALLHAPDVLFLDEPTIGLDAPSKLAVRGFIRQLNRKSGMTVILTTHDFDDIEAVCERVIVVADGRVVQDGTLDSLRRAVLHERRLTVDFGAESAQFELPGARLVERTGSRCTFGFDPEQVSSAELIRALTERTTVGDLLIAHPPIEEVISELYRQNASRG